MVTRSALLDDLRVFRRDVNLPELLDDLRGGGWTNTLGCSSQAPDK